MVITAGDGVVRVQCTFLNIESEAVPHVIMIKLEKNQVNIGMVLIVGDDVFRVQCISPNVESEAVLTEK